MKSIKRISAILLMLSTPNSLCNLDPHPSEMDERKAQTIRTAVVSFEKNGTSQRNPDTSEALFNEMRREDQPRARTNRKAYQ